MHLLGVRKSFLHCVESVVFSRIFLSLSISRCMHCAQFSIIVFSSQKNILHLEPVYFTYDAGFNNPCHSRMPSYFLWALYAAAAHFFPLLLCSLSRIYASCCSSSSCVFFSLALPVVWAVPNDARKCMCKVYFLSHTHTTLTRHLSYLWNSMLLLL